MRKIILVSLFILLSQSVIHAQDLRLNIYTSYVFDDKFDTYANSTSYFNGKVLGGFQWGGGLEYLPVEGYGIELVYFRQDTEVPVNYYNQTEVSRRLEAGINYLMVSGVSYVSVSPNIEGYGGLLLGAIIYSNKEPLTNEPDSMTKFAWGVKLGSNIWASDRVGLKIQAQLLSGVQSVGGSFYFGTGGVGAGVNTYSSFFQFSLGGGIVYRIGK